MSDVNSNPTADAERERAKEDAAKRRKDAKAIAEQRRNDRKNRKRHCALCGVEESEKAPFVPHPDGLGPICRETSTCEHTRAAGKSITR